jgi:uncharacterized protein with ParB-like and HNH nuclease domain
MKKILGEPKSVRELFTGVKYTIHYYQREYLWQEEQIEELINDLSESFLESFTPGDSRKIISQKYGHYFLGSILLTSEENAIIDGQQRLTSLSLLLIWLFHQLEIEKERADLLPMIYSYMNGEETFNIDVPEMPERENVMKAILYPTDEGYDIAGKPETICNIWQRYIDLTALMTDRIPLEAIYHFKDWLMDNVDFIRIMAPTEQDAHKVFVSMNDRGLSLTSTEMLKGYLLSRINDDSARERANTLWKNRILELKGLGKDEESNFIKNWLRAQFAETQRERHKSAKPGDFEDIGTAPHKWVRENPDLVKLSNSSQFLNFVEKDFIKFSQIYLDLKRYSNNWHEGFEHVFYNGNRNFTQQFLLILAAISPKESKEESDRKIKLVSRFLDMYYTRRIFNYKKVDYNDMAYNIFLVTKKIRQNRSFSSLQNLLIEEIKSQEFQINGILGFRLNGWSIRYMLHVLARLTEYIEVQSGKPSFFANYVSRSIKNPYDIEHILANDFERHTDEYSTKEEFEWYRSQLGALLILPRDLNRSLQDKPFEYKSDKYISENLLAKSLTKGCYQNEPQFLRRIEQEGFNFKPYENFDKNSIEERQALYEKIAQKIWGIEILKQV